MSFEIEKYKEIENFIKKHGKLTKIIAISKNHPFEEVKKAISFGVKVFGENKVQEARSKFTKIKQDYKNIELHLTGPLQSNKVKIALEIFDVFQTLDREKLANTFNKHKILIKNKKFFIQINTGKESNKSGIFPENARNFISYCKNDLSLPVVGLMCIPPISDNPLDHFDLLKKISIESGIEYLSMGMSSDYEKAILAGATHIRVGTKIFGERL